MGNAPAGTSTEGRSRTRRGPAVMLGRGLLVILTALATLVVGMTPIDAQDTPASPSGNFELVFISGNSAAWLIEDGTRQWLSPDCRLELRANGLPLTRTEWSEIADLVRIDPGPCSSILSRPKFVAIGGKGNAAHVIQNGTREWLRPECTAALIDAGVVFEPVSWGRFGHLPSLAPGNCSRFLPDNPTRFATFNASLNRDNAGDLVAELSDAVNNGVVSDQLDAVLQIIAAASPDVLLINEFDYDAGHEAAGLFAGLAGYPYWYTAPSNTGVASGVDLDNSGDIGGPGDAFGFGFHEGQFGMLVLSRYPIATDQIRTFQNFLWKDMPRALLPTNPDGSAWYSPEELDVFRLSSKSHWDVPIVLPGGDLIHFLVSHPTPPVFDGPEDRNGTRNHDEIRLWADYVQGALYIYDDEGVYGGLPSRESFVIAGDQNSDPNDGDSVPGSAQLLLENPRVNATNTPASDGGVEAAAQGEPNESHGTPPQFDTADFGEAQFGGPGNLRVDYVLPSADLTIVDSAVFWPDSTDPQSALTGTFPFPSSDHRLVWVEVTS